MSTLTHALRAAIRSPYVPLVCCIGDVVAWSILIVIFLN